jgi:hypothetical protein
VRPYQRPFQLVFVMPRLQESRELVPLERVDVA